MAVETLTFGCRLNAYEGEVMNAEAEKVFNLVYPEQSKVHKTYTAMQQWNTVPVDKERRVFTPEERAAYVAKAEQDREKFRKEWSDYCSSSSGTNSRNNYPTKL